jgi:mRNA-decapping enzyme subunit 2
MNDFRLHSIPLDILDDLGSRFIINVPEEERKDLIRICFQVSLSVPFRQFHGYQWPVL